MKKRERFIVTAYTRSFMIRPSEWEEFYAFIAEKIGYRVKMPYELSNSDIWKDLHDAVEFKALITDNNPQ